MAVTLKVRAEVLNEYRDQFGYHTNAELAAKMRVAESTLSRVMAGYINPGHKFYIGLRQAFPGVALDRFFELVEPAAARKAA